MVKLGVDSVRVSLKAYSIKVMSVVEAMAARYKAQEEEEKEEET